jgi:hypothetical protein
LEATDLIEVSTIESGSYVTRSITGQELIDAIPAPTGFVPTSRTLTINGVAQDLSADRSWTISTGLTVGTTPIASGTIGRVLFQGTGNVLQQSSSLFWDGTNNRLGIGTSSPAYSFQVKSAAGNPIAFFSQNDLVNQGGIAIYQTQISSTAGNPLYLTSTNALYLESNGVERMRIFTNGNVAINTTTDAGFRLDVNGTARVQGALTTSAGIISNGTVRVTATTASPSGNASFFVFDGAEGTNFAYDYGTSTYRALAYNGSLIRFLTAGTERARFAVTTGNFLINTTTDAGFRLDVNGTARVSSTTTIGTSAHPFGTNLLTLISDQGSSSFRIGGGSTVVCTSSISAVNLSANDFVQCVRVLVGSSARLNGGTLDWLSITNWAQSSLGSGNVSANLATFGTAYATINASAQVEIASTTRGFLPPRMTTTQRNAIASPAAGLIVYDTTLNLPHFFNGTIWVSL